MMVGSRWVAVLAALALLSRVRNIVAPSPEPTPPRPTPRPPTPRPGARLTLDELFWLAISVGFTGDDAKTAAAIAMAESGGNPRALGDKGQSYGLWQVHRPSWPQAFEHGRDMYDPTNNAQTAHEIFVKVGTFKPWTTYRTGAHRKYLAELNRKR